MWAVSHLWRVDVCGHVAQVAPGTLGQGVAHVAGRCLQVSTCAAQYMEQGEYAHMLYTCNVRGCCWFLSYDTLLLLDARMFRRPSLRAVPPYSQPASQALTPECTALRMPR